MRHPVRLPQIPWGSIDTYLVSVRRCSPETVHSWLRILYYRAKLRGIPALDVVISPSQALSVASDTRSGHRKLYSGLLVWPLRESKCEILATLALDDLKAWLAKGPQPEPGLLRIGIIHPHPRERRV